MLKLTAVKIFRAVFCALQKVSFSAQNGQSFQACLFPLVLLINISFEVIFFYGFHRLLYTTKYGVLRFHANIVALFIFLMVNIPNIAMVPTLNSFFVFAYNLTEFFIYFQM